MFDVRPLTVTIGAEVHGVDLASVDDHQLDELRKLWLDWKVLFFRDQNITKAEHVAFGERFGTLEVHPFAPNDDDHPEILRIISSPKGLYAASSWHSDVTWRERPSFGSILRGVRIPAVGGDTLFSDAGAAYNRLSDEWKERVDGLVAVHDYTKTFGAGVPADKQQEMREKYPPSRHPVIRTHPDTGAKLIYTNGTFVASIDGLSDAETTEVVTHLERAIMDPSVQCRFRWQENSFAMWDNRAVQHYATNDFWPETRVVERVTIEGDRPY